jgi:hypothetical protein
MSQMKSVVLIIVSVFVTSWLNVARADGEVPISALAGSWIADVGPDQVKATISYTPIGGGKFAAVESILNFDWSLGGTMPATHATTLNGFVKKTEQNIDFTVIGYALDDNEKAVYILKAVGAKVFQDKNTISVENLVFHIYTEPEFDNPVTDPADFTIPPVGVLPPFDQYRIQ